jgi:hypothetical protein
MKGMTMKLYKQIFANYTMLVDENSDDVAKVYEPRKGAADEIIQAINDFALAEQAIADTQATCKRLADLLAEAVFLMRRNPDMREIELLKRIREELETK